MEWHTVALFTFAQVGVAFLIATGAIAVYVMSKSSDYGPGPTEGSKVSPEDSSPVIEFSSIGVADMMVTQNQLQVLIIIARVFNVGLSLKPFD